MPRLSRPATGGCPIAIPVYAAQAGGGKILSLDDQSVVKDLAAVDGTGGNSYSPTLVSTPFADANFAKLRRLTQMVKHEGAVTVAISPWVDDVDTGQAITRTLAVGANGTVTAPLSAIGTMFQLEITLSAFDAACGLGSADLTMVNRRTQR